jgi:hypothetical protein
MIFSDTRTCPGPSLLLLGDVYVNPLTVPTLGMEGVWASPPPTEKKPARHRAPRLFEKGNCELMKSSFGERLKKDWSRKNALDRDGSLLSISGREPSRCVPHPTPFFFPFF